MPRETFLDTFDQQLLLDEVSNWIICWAAEKKKKEYIYEGKISHTFFDPKFFLIPTYTHFS